MEDDMTPDQIIADLREEISFLREELDAEEAHADGKECEVCTHLQITDLLAKNIRLEKDLAKARAKVIRKALRNGPSGGRMTAGQRQALDDRV